MGDYYNTTRGPLSVTLNDGSSCVVSPKAWIFVASGNENSASITKLIQKGFLVRAAVPRTVDAPAPVAPVVPVPEPVAPPPAPSAPVVSASAPTSSMKEEIFKKKR